MPARMPKKPSRSTALTEREMEVVSLIASGENNRFIGEQLGISEETVKRHVSSALDKRGLDNRSQLAVWWSLRAQYEKDTLEVSNRAAELEELDRQIGLAHRILVTLRREISKLTNDQQATA